MAGNEFDEILYNIIKTEEQKMRADFTARNPNNYTERNKNTIGGYFKSLYDKYHDDQAAFDEVNIDSRYGRLYYNGDPDKEAEMADERFMSKMSYASIVGMKAVFNLGVAWDIKGAIDKYFEDDPDNKLRAKMKDYVTQKLAVEGQTEAEKKLIDEIKARFTEFVVNGNGTTQDFMSLGYDVFQEMNDRPDEFMVQPIRHPENNSIRDKLALANRDYVNELKNTAICHLDYRAKSAIEPEDFLDCYKSNKYTDDAGEFADNMFYELTESLREQSPEFNASRKNPNANDFTIDGQVANGKNDVIAALVSGKNVKFNGPGCEDEPLTVQPRFYVQEKEKPQVNEWERTIGMSISEFFEELWESIKDALGVSDRERARKMNEEIKQSDNRLKTSFSEITDANFSDKLISREKREKIKEKELKKSESSKK